MAAIEAASRPRSGPSDSENPMSFRKDNDAYEAWLKTQCEVVAEDIAYKHEQMRTSAFVFLRATYFRWAKQIGKLCPTLMDAPQILSIGDLHLENFGTWRDADGRFVWGVNDFDEAAVMPYVLDLVRLAASIRLAPDRAVPNPDAAAVLLKGYREGLKVPQPALLDEGEIWLRDYAIGNELDSGDFWEKLNKEKRYPLIDGDPKAKPPLDVTRLLNASLPNGASNIYYRRRIAGAGSLGRPRYVAIADWRGGRVVREAKAKVPSAWLWAHGTKAASGLLKLANGKYRAPDPFLIAPGKFVLRRLAPDSRKIELGNEAKTHLKADLLQAMAFDLASVHAAGSVDVDVLRNDLKKRRPGWLYRAAKTAAAAVEQDFEEWKSHKRGG
jgi:hypothetical protein